MVKKKSHIFRLGPKKRVGLVYNDFSGEVYSLGGAGRGSQRLLLGWAAHSRGPSTLELKMLRSLYEDQGLELTPWAIHCCREGGLEIERHREGA
jgi:hypothetical protein